MASLSNSTIKPNIYRIISVYLAVLSIYVGILVLSLVYVIYPNTEISPFSLSFVPSDNLIHSFDSDEKVFTPRLQNATPFHKYNTYGYCSVTIDNPESLSRNFVIVHDGRVRQIHLLQVIHGDITQIATNIRKKIIPTKSFFIVSVPANDSATFFLEYIDKKIPFINPKVMEYDHWRRASALEYALFQTAKIVLMVQVLFLLTILICIYFMKIKNGITEKNPKRTSLLLFSLMPILMHGALCFIAYYLPLFQGRIYGKSLQVSLLYSLLAAAGLYLYGSLRYFLMIVHYRNISLQAHIRELEDLHMQKMITVDQLSKTIATENLGEVLSFLDSIASSARLIKEGTHCASFAQSIEQRISMYITALQTKYRSFAPTHTITDQQVFLNHASIFEGERTYSHTVALYDFDQSSIDNTTSILEANAIRGIQYTDKDLVLLDIEMGSIDLLILNPASSGSDSFSLCMKVRAIKNMFEFPILMTTNYCSFFGIQQGYNAGINDFIIKPYSSAELANRVHSLMQQRTIYDKNSELMVSDKEKRTFLYFITHNINSPLTLILNQVEDLISSEHIPADLLEQIEEIGQAADEINLLIQNVLTSYKLNDGYFICMPQTFHIAEIFTLLQTTIEHKVKGKGQTVVWDIHELPHTITYDRTSLWGILNNLLDNASKFSPQSSQITCITRIYDTNLLIHIKDQGPGIPPAEVPFLFNATRKISNKPTAGEISLGLGLHVTSRLAELNNSTLSYREGEEGGSCFTLSIPLQEDLA